MKQNIGKVFTFILLLLMVLAITSSCDASQSSETQSSELGLSDDNSVPYWNGMDFGTNLKYFEEYQLDADAGDNLNAAEAAKVTFDTMKNGGNIPDYSDDTEYTMTFIDLMNIDNEECYVYRLDIGNSDTLGASYAYAYQSGNIYMQGMSGTWIIPESDESEDNAHITFMTQEYKSDNIAEIPYIEYDGDKNFEIDAINNSINQGIQRIYNEFMGDGSEVPENTWIEIKSYPFTSSEYLQVVVTSNIFPTYGTDGDLFSVNYDKKTGKWISVDDILKELDMDSEQLLIEVGEAYEPEFPEMQMDKVEVTGFLMHEGTDGHTVELFLEITEKNVDSDTWKGFYSFTPESRTLFRMDNVCLFDPNAMDQMTPPLSYQKI